MNDIYQSPEFLNAVAAGVVVLIILVFLLKYPFRKKTSEWTISQHYMYLSVLIKSSQTAEQLNQVRPEIDKFFDKHHRRDRDNQELKRYYERLLKSISEKEKQFKQTKVAI